MSDFLDLQGAKDLNTDAIHLSAVANSKDPSTGSAINTHTNRVGGTDYTLNGFWNSIGPVVMSWTSVVGGTLTQPNQAFLHPTNGNYYSWTGAFPKVVAPGADPTSVTGYVPRTDVVLRNEITTSVTEALRRSYAEAGFNLVDGSFEEGGTLTSASDVLLHKTTAEAYAWSGAFPKVVNAWSTPATSGGIGAGAWVDRTDSTFRSELSSITGTVVSVEQFGALGYPSDDAAAFQKANNYLYSKGGGTLLLTKPKYFVGQYTGSDTNNSILHYSGIANSTVSKCVFHAPNTTMISVVGESEIVLNGGSSSPVGYNLSSNYLAFSGERLSTAVSSVVSNNSRQVVVPDTSLLSVGKQVLLGRLGGNVAGVPNTPSQEIAPCQFLHISSISGTTVTFKESFIHDFKAVTDLLYIWVPDGGREFTKNVYLKNIKFSKGANSAYVLMSSLYGFGFDKVTLNDVSCSYGTSQKTINGDIRLTTTTNTYGMTIESVSDVKINSFNANAKDSTNSLGPLFFSDNCRQVRIGRYYADGFINTGFAALYSIDAEIDHLETINCGVNATTTGFNGAITVGFPAEGVYASRTIAESNFLLMRNLGKSKLKIKNLVIKGNVTVPVRAHDIDLQVGSADIDHYNSIGTSPFFVGKSGSRRADTTYYPKGGELSIRVDKLNVNTLTGSKKILSCLNGYAGLFKAEQVTATSAVSSGSSVIPVTDGSVINQGDVIRCIEVGTTTPTTNGYTVQSVSGNNITVTPPLIKGMAIGAGIYSASLIEPMAGEVIDIRDITFSGVQDSPISKNEVTRFPDFQTGTGPYTATLAVSIPSAGEWQLDVINLSKDYAHYEKRRYLISYDPHNTTYPIAVVLEQQLQKMRSNATVNGAEVSGNTVTVTVGSSSSGKQTRVYYTLTPQRQITKY